MQTLLKKGNRAVAIWLLIGVGMIIIQVLLGGITRLTGSGLSITEWKPILGAIPPTNENDWQKAFEQYQQIGQYKYLNQHFTIGDFKFIYFWEWFHRVWARLIGIVFLIGFFYLLYKKYLRRDMVKPMVILFFLGALQGAIGWIMVKSGLNENDVYVNHIRLALHFIAALGLLAYTFWFALKLLVPQTQIQYHQHLHQLTLGIVVLLVLQLIYGAFMAGLKAAVVATTWPDINGAWIPDQIKTYGGKQYQGIETITNHPMAVQFIHRTIAYLLLFLIIYWFVKIKKWQPKTRLLQQTMWLPLVLVCLQVVLGIVTLINASNATSLLWLGVAHQFVAMLLLMSLVWMLFIIKNHKSAVNNMQIN